MHRNNALLVKKIGALVGKYNTLAAERGMQKIPYPSYGKALIDVSKSFLVRDLKTIGKVVKEIEEIPVGDKMKTAKGVRFTEGIISELPYFSAWKDEEGLWYYILDGDDICVYAVTEEIKARMNGGTELTLDYADMPYEVLVDTDGKEWKVNRYTARHAETRVGLFGSHETAVDWNNNVNKKLTSLTLQDWTNRNATDMMHMFYGCEALTSLNLSNFNTEKVMDMRSMFYGCEALTSLDLSSFNTEKVMDMRSMFSSCSALTSLDLSSFDTRAVTSMLLMFSGCEALTALTLGENFTVVSGENSTELAPENPCEITMNNASYTVLKERELTGYTFDPDSWTSPSDGVQTFTVTPFT